jgi:hypothetical protein
MKKTRVKETYVSTDIEADGPIPGPNSMISLGSAAFSEEGEMLGTFEANLEPIAGAGPDPGTMAWWSKNMVAYGEATRHPRPAEEVMNEYYEWVIDLPGRPVFVGYPATYDFMFVYWYLMRFKGDSPFSFSGLDIKTYAMAQMGTQYRQSSKRNMPKRWFDGAPAHSHKAIEDAIGQGILFHNMRTDGMT